MYKSWQEINVIGLYKATDHKVDHINVTPAPKNYDRHITAILLLKKKVETPNTGSTKAKKKKSPPPAPPFRKNPLYFIQNFSHPYF